MKRIFLIISLLACLSLGGNAQIRFGLKMGPSFDWANAGSTAVTNQGVGLGFGAGLVVEHELTSNLSITSGLELHLLQMKYQFTDRRLADDFLELGLIPIDRSVRSTCFEIPLKGKLKMDVADSWNAFVEAGFGLGLNYADKAKDEYDFHWDHFADAEYTDYSYQYRLLQASLCFGLGTEFEINSRLSLFAQLTYNHSLSNAFTHQMYNDTGSELHTNYIGIELGFLH